MNLIEKYHMKFMEWHYRYLIEHSQGFLEHTTNNGKKEFYQKVPGTIFPDDITLIENFGSSYVDENDNFCLINDGPYDPSKSQVWGIFECPKCKTSKLGIQTNMPCIHFSPTKHNGDNNFYYYKLIKKNFTWEQARKIKVTNLGDIFGFTIPLNSNCPYAKPPTKKYDINKEINDYIKILDDRVNQRKIEERKKVEEIEKEHKLAIETDLQELINKNSNYKPSRVITRFKRNTKLISDLKNKYKNCQLCNFSFLKKNGEPYTEIHHIISLSDNGKDEKINTLILCANCHRKMHYADVSLNKLINNIITINNEEYRINYEN